MKNNIKQFQFPTQVKEAARLMAKFRSKAAVVGGGTRTARALPETVEVIVDISDLPLKHIQADKSWLHIGALCTLAQLERSPLLRKWADGIIAKAAGFGASAVIRSMGTVGGNIIRPYPYNNLPPILLALGARVACTDGSKERVLSFEDFLNPKNSQEMGTRYLLTEVRIPAETKGWIASAQRIASTPSDWLAVANSTVAFDLRRGVCRKASIVLGAVLPRAAHLKKAEKLLEGSPCTRAAAEQAVAAVREELSGIPSANAKPYAREAAAVLIQRSLLDIFKN